MSDLKSIEKSRLEKYLDMNTGYVCDFSNATFSNFILENTSIDIYSDTYNFKGESKANHLRAFWEKESNSLVAKVLKEMLEYWKVQKELGVYGYSPFNQTLYSECQKIITRLQSSELIENIDFIKPNSPTESFAILTASIKEGIERGELYQVLDRLHTFMVKYMRELCKKHSIEFDTNTPLHSLFGMYRKFLEDNGMIESDMTDRILKSSISILDSFSTLRNNKSLAHDNPVINQHESALIISNVSNIVKFITFIEAKLSEKTKKQPEELLFEETVPTDQEMEAAADAWIQLEIDRRRGK